MRGCGRPSSSCWRQLRSAAFRENIKEAADIDGASAAFRFFRITLPLSAPILFIALLLRLIDAFKQYDLFFALTGGGPGAETRPCPSSSERSLSAYFYTGQASALAVIMLIIITGLSMIFVRHLNAARQGKLNDGLDNSARSGGALR